MKNEITLLVTFTYWFQELALIFWIKMKKDNRIYIKDNYLTYLTNVLDLIGASEWKEIKDEFLFEATTIF